ncbi:MAG: serine hydrolase [Chryseolinea sp.]
MLKKIFLFFLLVAVHDLVTAQTLKSHWVDSVFSAMSMDEKIGQLFMLNVPAHATPEAIQGIKDDVKTHDVGGIIFDRESPDHQAAVTKILQSAARFPLLVGQDGEQGIGEIDSTNNFPQPLILGAVQEDSLLYNVGRETANDMKILGLNLIFSSLADVNNPQNGLIAYMSFGENKINVANRATAFMRGLQDNGVLACAKQYRITGLTVSDYVGGLPRITASIDSVQSYPFTRLFANRISGVMPAAIPVPMSYPNAKLKAKSTLDPGTLSQLFTGKWLKEKQNFAGLTFVDLQLVKISAEKTRDGDEAAFAFQAGNDILIGPNDIGPAIRKIKKIIKAEKRYEEQLNNTTRKILSAKYDAGLSKRPEINLENLSARLNSPAGTVLRQKLYEKAVTVIRNDLRTLPIVSLENKRFAYVTSNVSEPNNIFYNYLSKYVPASYFSLDEKTDLVALSEAVSPHQILIVGIFPETQPVILKRLERMLSMLQPSVEIIYCDFGNETFLRTAAKFRTVITAYFNTRETLRAVPEVIFGGIEASGALPFSPSKAMKAGTGIKTKTLDRLVYSVPEEVGMNSKALSTIDAIAAEAILTGATPGMQIIVARNGKVVYEKNFGTQNHNKSNPVTDETIYDLASLTKVSATLQTVMFMYEKGLININRKVSYYLPELKGTNKKDITILEMLTHQAGLAPFIPMWTETVKDTVFLPRYYSRVRSERYPLQVSPNLYASPIIRDSVWSWIVKSKLIDKAIRTPFVYKYSDLGFLILQRLAERILNQPLDEFVSQNLYEPLGAGTTGFLPLSRFPTQQIAPTEDDRIFRRTLVTGTVHDERGAMMGGVAGHAGLFSNANDLAKLGQMLLNEGSYGGYRYYKPETVRLFAHKQFDKSRRGLGWDKPIQSDWSSPTSLKASPETFGHTGFTGTCMWIDPEFDLVFVFLSNRVYPDRSNKLNSANIRSRIQDVIYDAIFTYCDEFPAGEPAPENKIVSSRR